MLNKQVAIRLIRLSNSIGGRFLYKPSNVKFVKTQDGNERLFCIYSTTGISTLCVMNEFGKLEEAIPTKLFDQNRKLTKEEILLKQRKRDNRKGITSYGQVVVDKKNYIFFNSGVNVHLFDYSGQKLVDISGDTTKIKLDVKFSKDGEFFSFVNEDNVFVQSTADPNLCMQITNDADKEKHITAGVAEYIIQEEFDRVTGYWISDKKIDGNYCISYFKVDSSMVPKLKIAKEGFSSEFEEYYYPRPGEKNAVSELVTVTFNEKFEVQNRVYHKDLFSKDLSWMEYIVESGWIKGKIWMSLLSRRQKRFAIILYDVKTQKYEIIHEEENKELWINVTKKLYFFEKDDRIIVGSEKDGYSHLYLYDKDEKNGRYVVKKQLTKGEWVVLKNEKMFVDEKNELIYFSGTKDDDLESHLYKLDLKDIDKGTQRLTLPTYSYSSITFNSDKSKFFAFTSNIQENYVGGIFESTKGNFTLNGKLDYYLFPAKSPIPLQKPNVFNFKSSKGEKIYGVYYLPNNFDEKKSYPVVVYMYGGPSVQLVKNDISLLANSRAQLFTNLNYIFVTIDSEGSSNRGLKFQSHMYKKMGQMELQTQIEGIKYLKEKLVPSINLNRVGLYGYSYGGYMALMAISQHSDFFKVACSGSPVTDWRLYDTGYTERFMDLPEFNKEGYEKGSVLHYIEKFPDSQSRVLITHGMQDENVLFKNTEILLEALAKNLKFYTLCVYPSQRHMFVDSNMRIHSTFSIVDHFMKYL